MRPLNAKARFLFCSLGFTLLYGCTVILDLGDKHFEDTAGSGSSSSGSVSSGGTSSGSGGGGGMSAEQIPASAKWIVRMKQSIAYPQKIKVAGSAFNSINGMVLTAGSFYGNLSFPDSPNSVDLIGNTDAQSVPVATLFWAKHDILTGALKDSDRKVYTPQTGKTAGSVEAADIAWSPTSNAYFIVGNFSGHFYDGNSEHTSIPISMDVYSKDVFVLKLREDGSTDWCRTFGSTEDDLGAAVEIGPTGELYVAMNFRKDIVFATPDKPYTVLNKGGLDGLVLRLSPDGSGVLDDGGIPDAGPLEIPGQVLWVQSMGSPSNDGITDIKADSETGNVAVTGNASTQFVVGPGIAKGEDSAPNIFALILNKDDGSVVLNPTSNMAPYQGISKAASVTDEAYAAAALLIQENKDVQFYIGGTYKGNFTWGLTNPGKTASGDWMSVLMRFTLSNTLTAPDKMLSFGAEQEPIGATTADVITDIAYLASNGVFITGTFADPFALPGGNTHVPESEDANNEPSSAYIAKMNTPLDDTIWVKTFGPSKDGGQRIKQLLPARFGSTEYLLATGTFSTILRVDDKDYVSDNTYSAFVMRLDI